MSLSFALFLHPPAFPQEKTDEKKFQELANKQRRRLSVAPEKVRIAMRYPSLWSYAVHPPSRVRPAGSLVISPQVTSPHPPFLPPFQVGDISSAGGAAQPGSGARTASAAGLESPRDDPLQMQAEERKDGSPTLNIRVAQHTKKGHVPYNKNKVNQDRLVVAYEIGNDPNISLFGVMDGHGENGHLVAEFVRVHLPKYLSAQPKLREDPAKYIAVAVKKMCIALQGAGINTTFSGTTAVFGVFIDDTLHVANIGDSRCVLGRLTTGDVVEAVPLSNDHKPDVPAEKARILAAGGRVCPLPGLETEDRGPDRVWLEKVDVPGLAMSRSIGDEVSQRVGVISVPEVIEHKISKKDLFAVWASDGVWEFLSNDAITGTIVKHLDNLDDAARAVVTQSVQQWQANEEVVDDITCVIVQFNV